MSQEIERKFLVRGPYMQDVFQSDHICQGYLCHKPTVRVRIRGERAYLTIKGPSDPEGLSRYEWEKEIPASEGMELLKLAEPGIVDKTRHLIRNTDGRHVWEVDEFHGANSGLVIAEVELSSEDDRFDRPEWLGEEVTGDRRYYNSYLARVEALAAAEESTK